MFSFIKKLLGKSEPAAAAVENVARADLARWVEARTQPLREQASRAFTEQSLQLREALDKLNDAVEALRNAQLINPNITEREKQFMAGNREAFIRAAEQFKASVVPPANQEEVQLFAQTVHTAGRTLLETIPRQFQILQEFFAHEAKDVLKAAETVENQGKAMAQSYEQAFGGVATVRLAIDDLERALDARTAQELTAQSRRDQLRQVERELADAQRTLAALEQGTEYAILNQRKQELQTLTDRIKTLRASLSERFSSIEPALKKYEHMTLHNQDVIAGYLKEPVETLARDRDLTILRVIAAMRKELVADRIDLKDRKKEKVLAAMDELTPLLLNDFLKQYGATLRQQNELVRALDAMQVLHQLAAARKKVAALTDEKTRVERELSARNEATDVAETAIRVQALVKQVFNSEIRISGI
jgi:hypothetical protein